MTIDMISELMSVEVGQCTVGKEEMEHRLMCRN